MPVRIPFKPTTADTAALVTMGLAAAPAGAFAQSGQGTGISLIEAVEAAQASTSGKVIEAERESEDDRRIYEVEVVADGSISTILIDATSGDTLSTRERGTLARLTDWSDHDEIEAAQQSPHDLVDILRNVERETGQEVREVELDDEDGLIAWDIELSRGDVMVDVASGQIFRTDLDD